MSFKKELMISIINTCLGVAAVVTFIEGVVLIARVFGNA